MTDEKKKLRRFLSTDKGISIQRSQCVTCVHNKGLQCAEYGDKPMKYASAQQNVKCPKYTKEPK